MASTSLGTSLGSSIVMGVPSATFARFVTAAPLFILSHVTSFPRHPSATMVATSGSEKNASTSALCSSVSHVETGRRAAFPSNSSPSMRSLPMFPRTFATICMSRASCSASAWSSISARSRSRPMLSLSIRFTVSLTTSTSTSPSFSDSPVVRDILTTCLKTSLTCGTRYPVLR